MWKYLKADLCVSDSVNQTSVGLVEAFSSPGNRAAGSRYREMSSEKSLYPLQFNNLKTTQDSS